MAIIKPFKGIRPPQDLVEQVASRPYDVLNSAEARAEAEGNEKSLYPVSYTHLRAHETCLSESCRELSYVPRERLAGAG